MWTFKTGDLIAKVHSLVVGPLQVGLVVESMEDSFSVKWTSYNKDFFMEKEEDIFTELNNHFLLDTELIRRLSTEVDLQLLNPSYNNEHKS
jgi:hypothetical protein